MNSQILNRDFAHPSDGWYQIEAKGNHPNRAAGVVQVIDDAAAQSIVNKFNADAKAGTLSHGNDMLIDIEHFKDDPTKETRAYGWLQELQNRADGIYGRIRWSGTGKKAVDDGDYRFFSTEYDAGDLQILNSGNSREVRPLRLDGLTLTNMNNNKGQKPITNRAPQPDAQPERKTMKSVAEKLGLSAEASEQTVLAEVVKLQNRVNELTPMETENTKLKNRLAEMETEQVTALLDLHQVKEEKVRNRLKLVLTNLKNREERVAALVDFGFKQGEEKPAPKGRVINRADSKADTSAATESADEQQLAQKAEAEIQDYKIKNRCTYADARNAVRRVKPELFGLEAK